MKLANFSIDGRPTWGVVEEDQLVDVGKLLADEFAGVGQVLRGGPGALARVQNAVPGSDRHAASEVVWAPPVRDPGKVLCVGHNYASHVKETGRQAAEHPGIFIRVRDSLAAHGQAILRPPESEMLDFEGELAVIIGRSGRRIAREQALGHVAGYACFNDASVRDWQWHTPLVTSGKNFTQTGALGPWLTTADEVGDPSGLEVTTRLNGEVVQHQPTADMIFDVPALIAYLSTFTALAPGDVICTGTPGGVGAKRQPPLWMKPGDVVEVAIPRVGRLINPVADELER